MLNTPAHTANLFTFRHLVIMSNESNIKPYTIKLLCEADLEDALQILEKSFCADEPLNKYLHIANPPDSVIPDVLKYASDYLTTGVSFKAVTESGEIAGLVLNDIISRGDVDHSEASEGPFQLIAHLLETVEVQSAIWDKYPDVNKIMYVSILSVNPTFRGRKVAQELLKESEKMARELGCGLMEAICTGQYSALAMERVGWKRIYELRYEDYKINGEVVFKPEHPHVAVTTYVKRL